MKGKVVNTEDGWVVVKKARGEWVWEDSLPLHPDDEDEFGSTLKDEMDVEYEIVDFYEGEKLPWYFAKLIK